MLINFEVQFEHLLQFKMLFNFKMFGSQDPTALPLTPCLEKTIQNVNLHGFKKLSKHISYQA